MKAITTIVLVILTQICLGQVKNPWKGQPKSIQESFAYFDQMFDDTAKYTFYKLPEDIATTRLHSGFGRYIRNQWGLWSGGSLQEKLMDIGFTHPDDMSTVLLTAYHRHLHGQPLQLEEEVNYYKTYWDSQIEGENKEVLSKKYEEEHAKRTTLTKDLRILFPVGDTLMIPIYATHKTPFKKEDAKVSATVIIQGHEGYFFKIKVLSIQHKPNHYPIFKEGDEEELSFLQCDFISPKNWQR